MPPEGNNSGRTRGQPEICCTTPFIQLCEYARQQSLEVTLQMITRCHDVRLPLKEKEARKLMFLSLAHIAPRRNIVGMMSELRQLEFRGIRLAREEMKNLFHISLTQMGDSYDPGYILESVQLLATQQITFTTQELRPVILNALQNVWDQQGQEVFKVELRTVLRANLGLSPAENLTLMLQAQKKAPVDIQRETQRAAVTASEPESQIT